MTKHLIDLLKKSAHASLVFMTDAKKGAYWDAYTVSKKAVDGLMQNLAAEYEGSNLFVNSFNPGPSKTALHIRAFPASMENDSLPRPGDHKDLLVYLMSDELNQCGVCFKP
jgi:NAD(P)-dependent dehydrogenase (short-subunit alcohol dehydrogenase family)